MSSMRICHVPFAPGNRGQVRSLPASQSLTSNYIWIDADSFASIPGRDALQFEREIPPFSRSFDGRPFLTPVN